MLTEISCGIEFQRVFLRPRTFLHSKVIALSIISTAIKNICTKKFQCETKGEPKTILKFPVYPSLSEGAGWEWGGGMDDMEKRKRRGEEGREEKGGESGTVQKRYVFLL